MRSTQVAPIGALLLVVVVVGLASAFDQALEDEEIRAEDYVQALNARMNQQSNILAETSWAYSSNLTDHNERIMNDASAASANFVKVSVVFDSNVFLFITHMFEY